MFVCERHETWGNGENCPSCQEEKNQFYRRMIDQVAVAKGPGIETVFLPMSAEKVKAWDQKIFDAYMQENAMKTPTQEQLNSVEWWKNNVPDWAEVVYLIFEGARMIALKWGLDGEGVLCSSSSTVEQYYRPKPHPTDAKPESQEWVDGLPPAGTVCEAQVLGLWHRCEVLAVRCGYVVVWNLDTDEPFWSAVPEHFRPLKTDAEREREEVIDLAFSNLSQFHDAGQVLGELYDAGMLRKGGE